MVIFLNSIENANELVEHGIVIGDEFVTACASSLTTIKETWQSYFIQCSPFS